MSRSWNSHAIGVVCLVAGLILAGCGANGEGQVTGKWKQMPQDMTPRKVIVKGKSTTETPKPQQIQNATLELRPDKTFTMKLDVTVEGTWVYAEPAVALMTKTVDGKDPKEYQKHPTGQPRDYTQEIDLGLTEDFKNITLRGGSSMTGATSVESVTFVKG